MFAIRPSYARVSSEPIKRLSNGDLKPGQLGQLFRDGAKVVILEDHRVRQLWEALLDSEDSDWVESMNLWENSVLNIARNHQPSNSKLGDMLRLVPHGYGSVIRKLRIFPSDDNHTIQLIPNSFRNSKSNVSLSQTTLRMIWELMMGILENTLPPGSEYKSYAIEVQLIKYVNSCEDLDRMCSLISDSGDIYTRIGHRIDTYRSMASGFFNIKGARELFAIGCLIPGFNSLLHGLNNLINPLTEKKTSEHTRIIGIPHVDGGKFFSALASERDVIKTEIYDGKQWIELPMTTHSLAIFHAKNRMNQKLNIYPTRHRVLINEQGEFFETQKPNVTLLFGVVDRQETLSLSKDLGKLG